MTETPTSGSQSSTPTPDAKAPSIKLAALYAFLSFLALCVAGVMATFIVAHLDTLVKAQVMEHAFYVLLVVIGLAAAAFLFGAMGSYAAVRGRHLGTFWEVGGPAAFAVIVVVGGMMDWHHSGPFPLTVRLIDWKPVTTADSVAIDVGFTRERVGLSDRGEAILVIGDNRIRTARVDLFSGTWEIMDRKDQYDVDANGVISIRVRQLSPSLTEVNEPVLVPTTTTTAPSYPAGATVIAGVVTRTLRLCAEDLPKSCRRDEYIECVSPASDGNEFDVSSATLKFEGGGGTDPSDHDAQFSRFGGDDPVYPGRSKRLICIRLHTAVSDGRSARVDIKLTVMEKVAPANPAPPGEFPNSMPQARQDL